ncbi:transcriptional regulator, SarA/Rot family, partial [Mammaliicoccus sciuri]
EMSHNGCRTLEDIKDQFGWDLVKINKSIKVLVKLNYLDKERSKTDERIALVSIKKDKEKLIKLMIENVLKLQNVKDGEQNLAMVE